MKAPDMRSLDCGLKVKQYRNATKSKNKKGTRQIPSAVVLCTKNPVFAKSAGFFSTWAGYSRCGKVVLKPTIIYKPTIISINDSPHIKGTHWLYTDVILVLSYHLAT